MTVVLSTHPHTKKHLEELKLNHEKIIIHQPFGMFDYIKLQQEAFCNLSDSGTIHEDAAILGIPAINIRESNERPEVYDTGNVVMAGTDYSTISNAIKMIRNQIDSGIRFEIPDDYRADNCSDKVVRLIVGLHKIVLKRKYCTR